MGAQVRYGTIAVGAYMAHQPGSHQRNFGDQYHPKWDRGGARSPRTWKDKNRWYSLWSWGCRTGFGGGGNDGEGSRGLNYPDLFEPFSCDGEGTQSRNFLRGTCVDSSDVPIANPIVQGFRTSDDLFVGQVDGNTDGTYILGIEQSKATQHYLVGYKPGSPDQGGTTVNTLLPTNVDGTA
jgi:hypothetical protein